MNTAVRSHSGLAIASLACGILGWTVAPFVASIVAIVLGHMARAEIRRGGGALDGDALALAGLILGWIAVALWVLGGLAFVLFFGGLAWLAAIG